MPLLLLLVVIYVIGGIVVVCITRHIGSDWRMALDYGRAWPRLLIEILTIR